MSTALSLAAVLLGCLVLPGLAGGALLSAASGGPAHPGGLAARSLGFGVGWWLLLSGTLSVTVGISPASTWTAAALSPLACAALLAWPRTRRAWRSGWRGGRAELAHLAGHWVVAALAWLPLALLVLRTTWAPVGSTPWYYYGLAQQVARAGHVPQTSVEWGTEVPFLDDYRLFSTATAMLLQVADGIPALRVVTLLSVLLLASGAALLANALGAGRLPALAAAALTVGTGIGPGRLSGYRPEAFGLGLSLLAVTLVLHWVRHRHPGSLAAAALVTAALSQVHGIAFVGGGVMVVAAGLTVVPSGFRTAARRLGPAVAALGGAVLLTGFVVGRPAGTAHPGGMLDVGGLADPTWEFIRASNGRPASEPPTNGEMLGNAVHNAYGAVEPYVAVLAAVALLVLLRAALRRDPRRVDVVRPVARRFLVFTALSLLGFAAVAAFFMLGWDSYVPRRTGAQRLVLEATLLLGTLVAGALGTLAAGLVVRRPPYARGLVAVALLGGCVAVSLANTSQVATALESRRPEPSSLAVLSALPVPEGSVVLANGYGEGYLSVVTGGQVLLEGRAPYTFPDLLERSNELMRDAADFFRAPRDNLGFIDEHSVDYVVVGAQQGFTIGSERTFVGRVRLGVLDQHPRFVVQAVTPDLVVYRVLDPAEPG